MESCSTECMFTFLNINIDGAVFKILKSHAFQLIIRKYIFFFIVKNTLFKSADTECVSNTPESLIDNSSVMAWWLDGSHSLTWLSGRHFELINCCKPDSVCVILLGVYSSPLSFWISDTKTHNQWQRFLSTSSRISVGHFFSATVFQPLLAYSYSPICSLLGALRKAVFRFNERLRHFLLPSAITRGQWLSASLLGSIH